MRRCGFSRVSCKAHRLPIRLLSNCVYHEPAPHPRPIHYYKDISQYSPGFPINKSVYCLNARTSSYVDLHSIALCRSLGVTLEFVSSRQQRRASTWCIYLSCIGPSCFSVLYSTSIILSKMEPLQCAISSSTKIFLLRILLCFPM